MLHMYTKRIDDPGLIPALLAADIQFGAVKASPELQHANLSLVDDLHAVHNVFVDTIAEPHWLDMNLCTEVKRAGTRSG